MRKILISLLCLAPVLTVQAQDSLYRADSAKVLAEVTVSAYGTNPLVQTPAAINTISTADLARYSNTSVLPAVNATPGVRMEERSPGSYRFGIRGSALEAPFGVRNVKVYYDDIPFTEPGGNTYLNGLGFSNYQSLEIIKGPGSSLYGAGTGGVLLINSEGDDWRRGADVTYTGGSYGLSSTIGSLRVGDSAFQNTVRYEHLMSNGYREQSKLRKDVGAWDAVVKRGKAGEIDAHFLYSDMQYQTPGGLTTAEYAANPSEARPTTAAFPGAVAADAAIYQKVLLAGFTAKQRWSAHWQGVATVYGAYVQQVNPNIRNYSRVNEPYFGGRGYGKYVGSIGAVGVQGIAGVEVQQGYTDNSVFAVSAGLPQALQTEQAIGNTLATGFAQVAATYSGWQLSGGLSVNSLHIGIDNLAPQPYRTTVIDYKQVAPRVALLRKVGSSASLYAALEKGFSPPTTDELVPTGSVANLALQPERGWNYEVGARGYLLHHRLYFDVTGFYFRLSNAIVQRRDSAGGDYYLNAGGTKQAGIEALLRYKVVQAARWQVDVWGSYTGFHFRYAGFVQVETDYSGKQLPGVAPGTVSAGVSAACSNGLYGSAGYFYSSKIALNDANSAYAAAYHLLSARVGYKLGLRHYVMEVFGGGENLLNQKYSLGNDINAAGGRYYNAAPLASFFFGASLKWKY